MNEEDRKKIRLQLIELFHFDRHVSVDSSVSSTLGRLPTTVNVCIAQCRENQFPAYILRSSRNKIRNAISSFQSQYGWP